MKIRRLGCRYRVVEYFSIISIVDGPDYPHGKAGAAQNAFNQIGGGCFAVGSGDADHREFLRRVAVKGGRHGRKCLSGVFHGNDNRVLFNRLIHDDCDCAPCQRLIDKVVSIGGVAGYGDKEPPRFDILCPVVDRADFRKSTVTAANALNRNRLDELGQLHPCAASSLETVKLSEPLFGEMFR